MAGAKRRGLMYGELDALLKEVRELKATIAIMGQAYTQYDGIDARRIAKEAYDLGYVAGGDDYPVMDELRREKDIDRAIEWMAGVKLRPERAPKKDEACDVCAGLGEYGSPGEPCPRGCPLFKTLCRGGAPNHQNSMVAGWLTCELCGFSGRPE